MVQNLTSNSVFGSPLLIESSAFFGTTYRAVSLFAIKSVKRVTVFAVSFLCVNCTKTSTIKSIFFWCKKPKVVNLNAVSVATNMVNYHIFRYVTHGKIVRHPMSTSTLASKIESTVSVLIEVSLPKVATLFFNPLTIKPFHFFRCVSIHTSLPFSPLMPSSISYV